MQAYRRLESNHALDEALRRADEAGKPTRRLRRAQARLPMGEPPAPSLHPRGHAGQSRGGDPARTRLLALRGAGAGAGPRSQWRGSPSGPLLVVTDDFPCFVVPDQTEALARQATVPVIAVDGNTIVPLARLHGQGPAVTGAAHLRPRIHRDFADAWEHRASAKPRVPRVARSSLSPPFPPRTWEMSTVSSPGSP
jgi:deoxyribodipyrimidine photo-lyase